MNFKTFEGKKFQKLLLAAPQGVDNDVVNIILSIFYR